MTQTQKALEEFKKNLFQKNYSKVSTEIYSPRIASFLKMHPAKFSSYKVFSSKAFLYVDGLKLEGKSERVLKQYNTALKLFFIFKYPTKDVHSFMLTLKNLEDPYKSLKNKSYKGEKWCDVPYDGFSEYYEVSNFGRVRTKQRIGNNDILIYRKLLSPRLLGLGGGKKGCLSVSLNIHKKQKTAYIQNMVALCFVKKKDEKATKSYLKDGNPYNVHYKNIIWTTQSEISKNNMIRYPQNRNNLKNANIKNGRVLNSKQKAELHKMLKDKLPYPQIKKQLKVSDSTIYYHSIEI